MGGNFTAHESQAGFWEGGDPDFIIAYLIFTDIYTFLMIAYRMENIAEVIVANLQVKLDDSLRDDAQCVAAQLGLDLPSAVRMFLVQMVRQNGLPFQASADPFYSPANQRYLKKVIADIENGTKIEKHGMLDD